LRLWRTRGAPEGFQEDQVLDQATMTDPRKLSAQPMCHWMLVGEVWTKVGDGMRG
jgi:hypothetical protein